MTAGAHHRVAGRDGGAGCEDDGMGDGAATGAHWDRSYRHGDVTRSWYEPVATWSLRMLDRCAVGPSASVVDIGGGASPLVDGLLARGHRDLTVLDVAAAGLAIARQRLGAAEREVTWAVADVLTWRPGRTFDVWHDRAAFHFLVTDEDRARYRRVLRQATHPGSLAVVATFAPEGPPSCSGLPVARYDAAGLARTLGAPWQLVADDREQHVTPGGDTQPFTWAALRRD